MPFSGCSELAACQCERGVDGDAHVTVLQVASVIRWLMAYNPSQRPSAKQLLQSTMLPSAVGDEQLNDLLRSLPESSETRDRVVDTIFSLPKDPTELDPNELPGTPVTAQVSLLVKHGWWKHPPSLGRHALKMVLDFDILAHDIIRVEIPASCQAFQIGCWG